MTDTGFGVQGLSTVTLIVVLLSRTSSIHGVDEGDGMVWYRVFDERGWLKSLATHF
jgi:hypothetical protein